MPLPSGSPSSQDGGGREDEVVARRPAESAGLVLLSRGREKRAEAGKEPEDERERKRQGAKRAGAVFREEGKDVVTRGLLGAGSLYAKEAA